MRRKNQMVLIAVLAVIAGGLVLLVQHSANTPQGNVAARPARTAHAPSPAAPAAQSQSTTTATNKTAAASAAATSTTNPVIDPLGGLYHNPF
ncbi:MAG: hypothetical protein KGJ93_03730 [Patescibacteria group bacterium]|nr:hypothetical protein [Patescibacteria group bacterium]